MVHWSPSLQAAVSDLEVEYSEEPGALYFVKYCAAGGSSWMNFIAKEKVKDKWIWSDSVRNPGPHPICKVYQRRTNKSRDHPQPRQLLQPCQLFREWTLGSILSVNSSWSEYGVAQILLHELLVPDNIGKANMSCALVSEAGIKGSLNQGVEAQEVPVEGMQETFSTEIDSKPRGNETFVPLGEKIVDTPFVREQKMIVGTEVVAWRKGVKGDDPKPIVISGPSGVGKGTLISQLMKEFPSTFGFSVSHTTRAPREKEKDGVHYHFTEMSTMEKDIKDGKFLEFASVHGNLYGTSVTAVNAVKDAGKICILDIDVQGARLVRASPLDAVFIFVCPPSFEELEKRLRDRKTETEEQIQKRLRNARVELEEGKSPGLFDHMLVNDDLKTCYETLKKILGLNGNTDSPTYPSRLYLDSSPIKGGAPMQMGLNMFAIDTFAENLLNIKEPQKPAC
ncbi:hypothetical protein Scep_014168 [Stephania cephalantha]|uniref:guanylate kinase n=1 Tax=Stephania cephalantha TaxID=152367 RepID=A0AAP0J0F4_9MAGN